MLVQLSEKDSFLPRFVSLSPFYSHLHDMLTFIHVIDVRKMAAMTKWRVVVTNTWLTPPTHAVSPVGLYLNRGRSVEDISLNSNCDITLQRHYWSRERCIWGRVEERMGNMNRVLPAEDPLWLMDLSRERLTLLKTDQRTHHRLEIGSRFAIKSHQRCHELEPWDWRV